jgi:hypothetical protein
VRQSDRRRILLHAVLMEAHSPKYNSWSAERSPISLGIGPVNLLRAVIREESNRTRNV